MPFDPKSIRILYMGTPDFAIPALNALLEGGYNVVGVVTQPDKPQGRGYTLQPPPVKKFALEKGLEVYQPLTLKKKKFADILAKTAPDLIVVTAYGKLLPPSVLEFPRFGCFNLHGSILPAYRGAAPMQRAIMEGQTETGITVQQMAEGLDTGDILHILRTPITAEDNFETIHDRLAELSARALLETIDMLAREELNPVKQDDALSNYAAKIEKEDCRLDFTRPSGELHNRIRGLSPIPLTFARINGKSLKVTESRVLAETGTKAEPGTILSTDGGIIAVACGEGVLGLTGVLPEGKRRMRAADYINGRGVKAGDRFDA